MKSIHETAYPVFKSHFTKHEIIEIYTPLSQEIHFTIKRTKKIINRLCLLLLIKTGQRLGRFVSMQETPKCIITYLRKYVNAMHVKKEDLCQLDKTHLIYRGSCKTPKEINFPVAI